MAFRFEEYGDVDRAFDLMDSWRDRMEALIAALPRSIADEILGGIQSAAKPIEDYPKFMRVKAVSVDGWTTFGILPPKWAMGYRLKGSDVKVAVIYVKAVVRGGKPVSELASVLEMRGPWTMKTLPYEPTVQEAKTVVRMVSRGEVKAIEHKRMEEMDDTRSMLLLAGAHGLRRPGKILMDRDVDRDMAFEVLRHEFGVVQGSHPHWKPTLSRVYHGGMQQKFIEMSSWISDPKNMAYIGAASVGEVVSSSVAKRVARFQDLVSRV